MTSTETLMHTAEVFPRQCTEILEKSVEIKAMRYTKK